MTNPTDGVPVSRTSIHELIIIGGTERLGTFDLGGATLVESCHFAKVAISVNPQAAEVRFHRCVFTDCRFDDELLTATYEQCRFEDCSPRGEQAMAPVEVIR